MAYGVRYLPLFHEQLMELSDPEYDKVEHSISLLMENPYAARSYDPPYPAALPPLKFKWRWVPGTHKVIYFTVDEDLCVINLFVLADTRRDPLHRFDTLFE